MWDNLSENQAKLFMNDSPNQLVRSVIAERSKGKTVIDVGCGKGKEVELYDPYFYLGVDVSSELVLLAKKEHPEYMFRCVDGKNLPYEDNFFDHSICKSMLEHVESVQVSVQIFKEVIRVAKKSFICWHMPPIYRRTKIIKVRGYVPDPMYQNEYKLGSFDIEGLDVVKEKFEQHELWTVIKNDSQT